jgi:hypothetical protein
VVVFCLCNDNDAPFATEQVTREPIKTLATHYKASTALSIGAMKYSSFTTMFSRPIAQPACQHSQRQALSTASAETFVVHLVFHARTA